MVGFPLVVGLITAGVSLVIPHTYTSQVAFLPEASSSTELPAGLSGIAQGLGISVNREPSLSPQFYASVMRNRVLLEQVILSRYPDPRPLASPGDSVNLLPLLRQGGESPADSLNEAIEELRTQISVSIEDRTDIVYVGIDARYPELAAQIGNRLIRLLNDFNASTRKSRAGQRRAFLAARLETANERLRSVETDLQDFYQTNRSWEQSPELIFQEGRLSRRVDIQQEMVLTLAREYETAGIEEVNDTPVITVIEPAVPPTQRTSPRRTIMTILGTLLGGIVAIGWAFATDYRRAAGRATPEGARSGEVDRHSRDPHG